MAHHDLLRIVQFVRIVYASCYRCLLTLLSRSLPACRAFIPVAAMKPHYA
jgi:hypothetical protein